MVMLVLVMDDEVLHPQSERVKEKSRKMLQPFNDKYAQKSMLARREMAPMCNELLSILESEWRVQRVDRHGSFTLHTIQKYAQRRQCSKRKKRKQAAQNGQGVQRINEEGEQRINEEGEQRDEEEADNESGRNVDEDVLHDDDAFYEETQVHENPRDDMNNDDDGRVVENVVGQRVNEKGEQRDEEDTQDADVLENRRDDLNNDDNGRVVQTDQDRQRDNDEGEQRDNEEGEQRDNEMGTEKTGDVHENLRDGGSGRGNAFTEETVHENLNNDNKASK